MKTMTISPLATFYVPDLDRRDAARRPVRGGRPDRCRWYFTTFNRTDDVERICDILAAIACCRWYGTDAKVLERVNVAGFGKTGPWVALAGAVLGPPEKREPKLRFVVDGDRFDTSSEPEYLKALFVPDVLAPGGCRTRWP